MMLGIALTLIGILLVWTVVDDFRPGGRLSVSPEPRQGA